MAARKKSRRVTIVAMIVILAMVVTLLTAGLYALFSLNSNPIVGTYTMTDGSRMVLDDNGNATITIPTSKQSASTTYTVKGKTVTLINPQTGGNLVTFTFKDNTLTSRQGTATEVWTKQ